MQISENEDARLIVDAGCRRVKGLASVLEKRRAFDLMLIMAGTNHLAMGVAPCMVLHSIQALHAECQMVSVPQWSCVCPRAFSTVEDLSCGGLGDELK